MGNTYPLLVLPVRLSSWNESSTSSGEYSEQLYSEGEEQAPSVSEDEDASGLPDELLPATDLRLRLPTVRRAGRSEESMLLWTGKIHERQGTASTR